MQKLHLREIDAAGSGYSPDMAVYTHRNEPSVFVKSATFGQSVKAPRLSRSALYCQLMCDVVRSLIGRPAVCI